MPSLLKLKASSGTRAVTLVEVAGGDPFIELDLVQAFRTTVKFAKLFEDGQRLENLSWRLSFLGLTSPDAGYRPPGPKRVDEQVKTLVPWFDDRVLRTMAIPGNVQGGTRVSYPLDDVEVPNSPGSRGRIYSPLSSDLSEGGISPFEYGFPRTQRGGSRPVTRKVWPSERQLKEATSAERSDDDNQDAESPKISKPGIYDISASELRRGVCANCRRRKVKFDGIQPICGQCSEVGGSHERFHRPPLSLPTDVRVGTSQGPRRLPATRSRYKERNSGMEDGAVENSRGRRRTRARPRGRGSRCGSISEGHQSPDEDGESKKRVDWYDTQRLERVESVVGPPDTDEVIAGGSGHGYQAAEEAGQSEANPSANGARINCVTQPQLHRIDLANALAEIGVRPAGNLHRVPGLPVLADVIVTLIETCDNVPKQKQNIKQLQSRCVSLLEVLDAETPQGRSTLERLEETISEASEAISGADKCMKCWVKKNRWKNFPRARAGSIDDDVASCTAEINRIVEKLQFRRDTREIVERMHTIITPTANIQDGHFPQNAEDGYNAIKAMQQAYQSIDPTDEERKHRFNTFRENILKLQEDFGIVLPDTKFVENELQITSHSPVGEYGVYDIYPGTYLGREVWCRKLSYGDPDGEGMMRFKREVDIWSKLWRKDQEQRRSENPPPRVLPLYGFYTPYEGAACLVIAKPECGTLRELLWSEKGVDSLKIIKGIAKVLLLIHTMGPSTFHGDLNCTSIAIDKNLNPLLQNFRLSKTVFDVMNHTEVSPEIEWYETPREIEPMRWMAPETFNPRTGTAHSDIWSLGMVMYEILARKDPYYEYTKFVAIAKVVNGRTPNRPETIMNDKIWNLMRDCWTLNPTERPSIQDVIRRLDDL